MSASTAAGAEMYAGLLTAILKSLPAFDGCCSLTGSTAMTNTNVLTFITFLSIAENRFFYFP